MSGIRLRLDPGTRACDVKYAGVEDQAEKSDLSNKDATSWVAGLIVLA